MFEDKRNDSLVHIFWGGKILCSNIRFLDIPDGCLYVLLSQVDESTCDDCKRMAPAEEEENKRRTRAIP